MSGLAAGAFSLARRTAQLGVDFIDFYPGEIPTQTSQGRTVYLRENGPSGTLDVIVDGDGFLTNDGTNNPNGRGGCYVTVDAGAPVVYQSMEFIIRSGGTTVPYDQATVLFIPWTKNISTGVYAVPPTSYHASFYESGWTVTKYNPNSIPVKNGPFPFGYLNEDQIYTVESAIVDGKAYRFIDGYLLTVVEDADLDTLTGNFAGFEIFKNNMTDNEPGIRRLAFSTSEAKAREVRDRYIQADRLGGTTNAAQPVTIIDEFFGGGNTTNTVGELGWGHTYGVGVTTASGIINHPGIRALNTGAANNTINALWLGVLINEQMISMIDFSEVEFVFRENAAGITDHTMRVGLSNDFSSQTPTNAMYFEKLEGDTVWYFVSRSAGNQTRVATTIAARTNDWITLRIQKITSARFGAWVKINGGTEVLAAEVNHPTDYVAVGGVMQPGIMSVITGGVTRRVDFDYFRLTTEGTVR